MDEKRRTVFSKLVEIGIPAEKALDAVIGASEVGLSIITGLGATVAGLPGSTIETLRGRGTAEQKEKYPGLKLSEDTILPTVGQLTEDWTYQPKTETGQDYLENVGKVMEPVDEWLRIGSGAIPQTLGKVIPGDSRVEAGLMNAADQAIYTALNVMSPTRGASAAAMIGAKGAQGAMKALGAKNADLINPMAKAIEKTPGLKRYNQLEHAMGQLITRKQLAGLQPGMVQDLAPSWLSAGDYKKGSGGWYSAGKKIQKGGKDYKLPVFNKTIPKTFPKFGHLKAMAETAGWNAVRKMSNNQDAWLRSHYGITANVYQELERLGRVIDRASEQAKTAKSGGKTIANKVYGDKSAAPYLDEMGEYVWKGEGSKSKPMTVKQVLDDASNQYHAQIAYNRSVLEKYKPGDPRIERLASGELDQYLTPKHKKTTINKLKTDTSIIKDLIGRNIDDDVIRNHIGSKIVSDMRLSGNNVHISSKPFFVQSAADALSKPKVGTGLPQAGFIGRTIVRNGRKIKLSHKTNAPYAGALKKFVQENHRLNALLRRQGKKGKPITKKSVIDHFKNQNKLIKNPKDRFDIEYLNKSIVDDGDWISISQWSLSDDTLLATIPIRMIINKKNPNLGYYVLYDQMKQGSGIPILESILDAGSDTNRIYIDVHPMAKTFWDEQVKAGGERWEGYTPKVHQTTPLGEGTKREPVGLRHMAEKVREQTFDDPMSPEFLKKRRLGMVTTPTKWGAKRGSVVGLLSQEDENEQTRNIY